MSEFEDQIKEYLSKPSPWASKSEGKLPRIPYPYITSTPLGKPERLTLGEELIRRIEIGENPESAFLKVLGRGLRHPGTKKKALVSYLTRELERGREEGRI